jgi:hypothetical protein
MRGTMKSLLWTTSAESQRSLLATPQFDMQCRFIEPKLTATDYLVDLIRYKQSKVKDKAALLAKWRKHEWSSETMRQWANWQWKDMVG